MDDALREAAELDASDFADFCVDTTALTVPEVVERVRERTGGWPGSETANREAAAGRRTAPGGSGAAAPPRQLPEATDAPPVLLICGPTGVGKSTVGWEVYVRVRAAGLTAGYLDLDQVAFCQPAPPDDPGNHRVKARNLAAIRASWPAGSCAAGRAAAAGPSLAIR